MNTPIWIEAFGPGIGPPPIDLPIGQPVTIKKQSVLQGTTNPAWMQIKFQAAQLAVFASSAASPMRPAITPM